MVLLTALPRKFSGSGLPSSLEILEDKTVCRTLHYSICSAVMEHRLGFKSCSWYTTSSSHLDLAGFSLALLDTLEPPHDLEPAGQQTQTNMEIFSFLTQELGKTKGRGWQSCLTQDDSPHLVDSAHQGPHQLPLSQDSFSLWLVPIRSYRPRVPRGRKTEGQRAVTLYPGDLFAVNY